MQGFKYFSDKKIVSVETFKGRVQLSGFVDSKADANKAIEVTKKVKGVQSVIDSMKIR